MPTAKLTGLTAAPHTPFHADGTLNLGMVERQAEHLLAQGISSVFIAGTTGECHSLSVAERLDLQARWYEVARGAALRVITHVGANCLPDACRLAAAAAAGGTQAIAAVAPSYYKPRTTADLVAFCAQLAAAAPGVPFYYYDIPAFTGLAVTAADFLAAAPDRIPSLAGIKFTNPDLAAFHHCLALEEGRWDILWGMDEALLGGLATGATGAVGSSYNFAAPLYRRLLAAFERGDLARARAEQLRSVRLIRTLAPHGYLGAAKQVMQWLGVDVGPARPPNARLDEAATATLRRDLETLGYFDWLPPLP